jgi:hypothetical protein
VGFRRWGNQEVEESGRLWKSEISLSLPLNGFYGVCALLVMARICKRLIKPDYPIEVVNAWREMWALFK